MKAFIFNPKKRYNEDHGVIVIESTKKRAESLYLETHKPRNNNYTIVETDLRKGVLIVASGYDHVEIGVI